MQVNLEGRVALVTGASRGIGRSISIALADAGARVIITSRNVDKLQKVAEEIGDNATVIPADLSVEDDVKALFDLIKDREGRLDMLVNNAALGLWGHLVDFPISDFDKIMKLNVRGLYLCCQYALKLMIPRKSGYVINLSSVVGFKVIPINPHTRPASMPSWVSRNPLPLKHVNTTYRYQQSSPAVWKQTLHSRRARIWIRLSSSDRRTLHIACFSCFRSRIVLG